MSDWKRTAKIPAYIEAVKATETIEEPAVGFYKPSDSRFAQNVVIIKQNNTIIQLLTKLTEEVADLKEDFGILKGTISRKPLDNGKTKEDLSEYLENIQKKLENFHVGDPKPSASKTKKSLFYVFKDPQQIYEDAKKQST